MRSTAIALALVLAIALAPPAAAKASDPDYPPEFLALLPGWIADAEALATDADKERPWYAEADGFLQKARATQAEGRLRVTMFHIETYRELVLAHQLEDAAAKERSDAERRAFIASRTSGMKVDADRAWADFRATLHGYDGQLRSLHTIEKAIYAADVAIGGMLGAAEYDPIAREFPKQAGVPFAYVHGLVRSTATAQLNVDWARQMLAEAVKQEGLPPRVVEEAWSNLTAAAVIAPEGEVPPYVESLEALASPARNNSEALMAITSALVEQRLSRAYNMQTIFGDASTRGLNVVSDAARFMTKQLNDTTLETPRAYGLTGVFTSDAIDRARFTNEFIANGTADLGTVLVAWSALEHATYVLVALSSVSPVSPPPEKETPMHGALLAIGVLVAVALGRRS